MTTKRLIGSAPSQISRNKDLGTMAFQNKEAVSVGTVFVDNTTSGAYPVVKLSDYTGGSLRGGIIYGSWGGNGVYVDSIGDSGWVYVGSKPDSAGQATTIKFSTSNTERVRIDSSGNVGIGVTSPTSKLHITGINANSLSTYVALEGGWPAIMWRDTEVNQAAFVTYIDGNNFYVRSVPYANRNDANPAAVMQVGVYLPQNTGAWSSTSDERLKTDLEPITNAVEKVSTLRTVTGRFISDTEGKRHAFLIAQDVIKVLPEAVNEYKQQDSDTPYLGIQYTDVIPLLVAAIKELKNEIDTAKLEITSLKAALAQPKEPTL